MADSGGTFGGDGSVTWKLRIQNGKSGTVHQAPPVHAGGPVDHDGQDSSVSGANFRIVLRIPQNPVDRNTLQGTLTAAAAEVAANPSGSWTSEILLAIEDVQSGKKPAGREDDQIKVTWQST